MLRVTITGGVPVKERAISVWLDDSNDKVLKKFRCVHCGCVVFEYYSSVHAIVFGETVLKRPAVIMCRGKEKDEFGHYSHEICRTKYYVS